MNKYEGIDYDAKEVLLVSNENCYLNKYCEVEAISAYPISATRNIDIDDFLNNRKRLVYSNYHYIIIKDQYVDLVFPKITYYFAKSNFTLAIIVDPDYKFENNVYLHKLLSDERYQVHFYDSLGKKVIVFRRDWSYV